MSREVFRQSGLSVVERDGGGWSVCFGDVCRSDIVNGVVSIVKDDDTYITDALVSVVARALVERVAGWFHVHAGFLSNGTLIVGESGAGKTTTALALAESSTLLTDDVVFIQRRRAVVVARPMARPLHAGHVTLRMFPELLSRVLPGQSLAGKAVVSFNGHEDAEVVVTRLVFPVVADVPLTFAAPLSVAQALPRLLRGSAMVAWPGLPRAAEHLDALSALARLSSFRVTLGRDAVEDPGVIARALGAIG